LCPSRKAAFSVPLSAALPALVNRSAWIAAASASPPAGQAACTPKAA
jgi:hypothetical protein